MFPAETLAGIEEFFKSVDADGSGTVNKSELKAFLAAAGCPAGDIDATAEQVCNPLSCVVILFVVARRKESFTVCVNLQIASEIGGSDNVIDKKELVAWYEKNNA